jgi:putative OmpL-like beta-barrel porin-2
LDENENRADYDQNSSSYYLGATLATPIAGLRLGAAFDYLDVAYTRGETYSLAGYASFQATEKLSLHARAEYLHDRGDQKFFSQTTLADPTDPTSGVTVKTNPDKVLALTATAQYDLWKNVISRLEIRWDHSLSGEGTWGSAATDPDTGILGQGTLRNEVMIAANLIYKF